MADPTLSNVLFMANWYGYDGDTSVYADVDETSSPIELHASAQLDDAVTKFGNNTLKSTFSNSYSDVGTAADFAFLHDQTEDWTLEFWVRFSTYGSTERKVFSTNRFSGGAGINVTQSSSSLRLQIYDTTGTRILNQFCSSVYSLASLIYFKITFVSSTKAYNIRRQGTSQASGTVTGYTAGSAVSTPFRLANSLGDTEYAQCWYGPIRITKGEALDDADVPTDLFEGPDDVDGLIEVVAPPGNERVFGYSDYSGGVLDDYYVMEIIADPAVRIPISRWQSTIQTTAAQYLEVVVPSAELYIDAINAAKGVSDFGIYRAVDDGDVEGKTLMASAGMDTISYTQGPYGYTLRMSGYTAAAETPAIPLTRTATGVRFINSDVDGLIRARVDIDWLLRPGDDIVVDGSTLTAAYINYYVPAVGDAYMDVGER